jgi:plasmid stabilization system protein ParE
MFPERGWLVREELLQGCREIVVKRFRIIYETDGRRVKITKFVHGSRRLDEFFSKDE